MLLNQFILSLKCMYQFYQPELNIKYKHNNSEMRTFQISELKLQINMNRRKLYGICAKERNKYAKTQIKEDFAAGYKVNCLISQ